MIVLDIETTGLDPYEHHIVTIQTLKDGKIKIWKIWEQDEVAMLRGFLGYLRTIPSDETILGYNNLKFDVPFIVGRLTIFGMMNRQTYRLLYERKWVDLYQLLGNDYRSMRSWEEKLGMLRVSKTRGKDIPMLFANGEYETILAYVTEELNLCQNLYFRITENSKLFMITYLQPS